MGLTLPEGLGNRGMALLDALGAFEEGRKGLQQSLHRHLGFGDTGDGGHMVEEDRDTGCQVKRQPLTVFGFGLGGRRRWHGLHPEVIPVITIGEELNGC